MANDFSTDGSCKALWRFESGALTADSKGSNTLSNTGVAEATGAGTYKEGSCAADFETSENDYLSIADASLDAGFPLKNGDTVKKISVAFWCKPESSANYQYMFSKDDGSAKMSFCINRKITSGNLYISNGYNNGASNELWDNIIALTAGKWYHVGVAHDGVNKTCTVRVYDDTAGTAATYTHSWGQVTNVEDAPLVLGTNSAYSTAYDYDGILDEMAVFNRILTADEFDRIRAGTYTGWRPDEMYSLSLVDAAAWATAEALYRPFLIF